MDTPKNTQRSYLIRDEDFRGAYHDLGFMYLDSLGVPKDQSKALKLIQKASELGDSDSQEFLASPNGQKLIPANKQTQKTHT